jgi:hypothetical protein
VQKHEYELSPLLHMMPIRNAAADSSTGVVRNTLRVEMRIRRKPTYWIVNVWAPLFFFTGISFAAFAVEVTALANRLAITITILLVLVAYRFASARPFLCMCACIRAPLTHALLLIHPPPVMDRLPGVDYITLLDAYVQLCFAVVLGVTIHAVALAVRAESSLAYLMEPGAQWSLPIEWQDSQRTALWSFSTVWIVANVVVMPLALTAWRAHGKRRHESLHWCARASHRDAQPVQRSA